MQLNNLFLIDFSSDKIALSVFERARKKVVLKDAYFFETGSFQSPAQRDAFISDEIKNFYFKNLKYIKSCSIVLPRAESLVFFVEFPRSVLENLSNVISFEIEKYIPFPKKDAVYSHRVISKTKTSVRVMITATKREILNRYLGIFQRDGIKVDSVEVKTVPLCNYAEVFKGCGSGDAFLIDAAESGFEIIEFKGGEIAISKSVPARFKSIADKAGFLKKVTAEVECLAPSAKDSPAIYLMSSREEIHSLFTDDESVKAVDYNASSALVDSAISSNKCALFTSILSAAGKFGIGRVNLNLLSSDEEKKEPRFKYALTALLSVGLVASLAVWAFFMFTTQRQKLDTVNSYLSDYKKLAFSVEEVRTGAETIQKELDLIKTIVRDDKKMQNVIKELTLRIPDDSWLSGFDYRNKKFYIKGMTTSATGLIFKLEASPMFQNVKLTSSIINKNNGLEVFSIQGEVL